MSLERVSIPYESFSKIGKRIRHNDIIFGFYKELFEETGDNVFENRARSLDVCGKYIAFEYYRMQGVKDVKRINLCKDKFCPNCQAMIAQKREAKYTPVLDDLAEEYSLHHVVFTVPNCEPERLKSTLGAMYKKFGYMVRYFDGRKKVSGIDFLQYGYAGGVRALEITQDFKSNTFHPHFHCIVLLRKGIELEKRYVNQYSFDGPRLSRKFSEFEVLLQKVWYLLMNGEEVNAASVAALKQGYSVIADPAEPGKYHQVFKYAIKGCFKDGQIYDFATFKTLYYALHNRRIIQGYGLLHNYDFEEDELFEEEADAEYESAIAELKRLEEPVFMVESLSETMCECLNGNVRYISRSNFKRILVRADSG